MPQYKIFYVICMSWRNMSCDGEICHDMSYSTAQLQLHFSLRDHAWCHEKSTNIPVTCLRGPRFLMAWNIHVLCNLPCAMHGIATHSLEQPRMEQPRVEQPRCNSHARNTHAINMHCSIENVSNTHELSHTKVTL